jgi:hypothetical protein
MWNMHQAAVSLEMVSPRNVTRQWNCTRHIGFSHDRAPFPQVVVGMMFKFTPFRCLYIVMEGAISRNAILDKHLLLTLTKIPPRFDFRNSSQKQTFRFSKKGAQIAPLIQLREWKQLPWLRPLLPQSSLLQALSFRSFGGSSSCSTAPSAARLVCSRFLFESQALLQYGDTKEPRVRGDGDGENSCPGRMSRSDIPRCVDMY